MLHKILELQNVLCMSHAQLLQLAREVSGCARLRCVEDLIGCETLELLEDLQRMAAKKLVAVGQ